MFRERPAGHPGRRAAASCVVFILSEAAVGAGLVLFRLVADNESVARALFMSVHLMNTFVLLACLTLTAHFTTADARPSLAAPRAWPFALAAVALLLVGTSGAIAALGDTLYPATSLLGGIRAELSSTASLARPTAPRPPGAGACGSGGGGLRGASGATQRGDTPSKRTAQAVAGLVVVQLVAGLVNVALLAPVWLQIVHLLLADLVWIGLVLLAARYLTITISLSRTGSR